MSRREFELKAFQNLAFPVKVGAPMVERPTEAEGKNGSSKNDRVDQAPLKRVVVLLTGSDICLRDALAALKDLKTEGCYMTLVYSAAAEALLNTAEIETVLKPDRVIREPYREGIKNLLKNTDLFVVPNLTQNTLAKAATGIQDELPAILIWQYLMNGVKTLLSTESVFHGWFETDNMPMKRVMEGHVRTLVSFGAVITECGSYAKHLTKQGSEKSSLPSGRRAATGQAHYGQTGYQEARTPRDRYPSLSLQGRSDGTGRKRVITEDFIRGYRENELVIERGTVITPLALDLAKKRDIQIIRET